jgi:BlaI family transcriptional regulator, penicillinase repressor
MAFRRRDRITPLGELQLAVLDALQTRGEATVYEVMEAFPTEGRPKYSTVQTVLRSLEGHELVTHRVDGRTFVYRLVENPREVRRGMVVDLIERAFHGSPRAMVAALLDADGLTPDDLAEIKAAIAEHERGEADGHER